MNEAEWRALYPSQSAQQTIDALLGAVEETDEFNMAQSEGEELGDPCTWLFATRRLCLAEHEAVRFEDLAPLEALTQLRVVSLAVSSRAELRGLGALTSLKELELTGGEFSDFSFLASLTSLTRLSLMGSAAHALGNTLTRAHALERVDWFACVKDLGAVRELRSLKRLCVQGNRVRDVEPLAELTDLVWLELRENCIVDVRPLGALVRLEHLSLEFNCINDFGPLRHLDVSKYLGAVSPATQLNAQDPPMAAILNDWDNLLLWERYASWLVERGNTVGQKLAEKLAGNWSSLPRHWAPSAEDEARWNGHEWQYRNLRPVIRPA